MVLRYKSNYKKGWCTADKEKQGLQFSVYTFNTDVILGGWSVSPMKVFIVAKLGVKKLPVPRNISRATPTQFKYISQSPRWEMMPFPYNLPIPISVEMFLTTELFSLQATDGSVKVMLRLSIVFVYVAM